MPVVPLPTTALSPVREMALPVTSTGAVTGAVLMIIRLRGPINTLMRVLDVIQSGYASLARIASKRRKAGSSQDAFSRTPWAKGALPSFWWGSILVYPILMQNLKNWVCWRRPQVFILWPGLHASAKLLMPHCL